MHLFRSLELLYVGLSLQVWSCLFALSLHVQVWTPTLDGAGCCSWCSFWPLAESVWGSPAFGEMELGGTGRQTGGRRVQGWLVLLEVEQPCLQSTSCCCSQILFKAWLQCLAWALADSSLGRSECAGTACPVSCLACCCNVPSAASQTEWSSSLKDPGPSVHNPVIVLTQSHPWVGVPGEAGAQDSFHLGMHHRHRQS